MSETGGQELHESNPNAAGPERAAGGMGVSSERTGDAGPLENVTDGLKDTSAAKGDTPREELPPEQRPDQVEENPAEMGRASSYPSLDPRSEGDEPGRIDPGPREP
jgi:hypothetical protein